MHLHNANENTKQMAHFLRERKTASILLNCRTLQQFRYLIIDSKMLLMTCVYVRVKGMNSLCKVLNVTKHTDNRWQRISVKFHSKRCAICACRPAGWLILAHVCVFNFPIQHWTLKINRISHTIWRGKRTTSKTAKVLIRNLISNQKTFLLLLVSCKPVLALHCHPFDRFLLFCFFFSARSEYSCWIACWNRKILGWKRKHKAHHTRIPNQLISIQKKKLRKAAKNGNACCQRSAVMMIAVCICISNIH